MTRTGVIFWACCMVALVAFCVGVSAYNHEPLGQGLVVAAVLGVALTIMMLIRAWLVHLLDRRSRRR